MGDVAYILFFIKLPPVNVYVNVKSNCLEFSC